MRWPGTNKGKGNSFKTAAGKTAKQTWTVREWSGQRQKEQLQADWDGQVQSTVSDGQVVSIAYIHLVATGLTKEKNHCVWNCKNVSLAQQRCRSPPLLPCFSHWLKTKDSTIRHCFLKDVDNFCKLVKGAQSKNHGVPQLVVHCKKSLQAQYLKSLSGQISASWSC